MVVCSCTCRNGSICTLTCPAVLSVVPSGTEVRWADGGACQVDVFIFYQLTEGLAFFCVFLVLRSFFSLFIMGALNVWGYLTQRQENVIALFLYTFVLWLLSSFKHVAFTFIFYIYMYICVYMCVYIMYICIDIYLFHYIFQGVSSAL